MFNIDINSVGFYDPIGVTKSRICCLLANSKEVRESLQYKCIDGQYKDEYDPNNPLTLIWNCIIPVLKDPDTITTSDPQILVGVDSSVDYNDPRTQFLYVTIVVVIENNDLRGNDRYLRSDLIETAGVCAYTKVDTITHAIIKTLTALDSRTWIGDIQLTDTNEGATNNTTHYSRVIKFKVKEINIGNRGL